MNSLMKRLGSGLLALFMVLSVVLAVLPVQSQAATLTYNTGTRHDYNAELSKQALAYYTGSNTWDKLSVLKGSSGSCTDMSTPMFKALNSLMSSGSSYSGAY